MVFVLGRFQGCTWQMYFARFHHDLYVSESEVVMLVDEKRREAEITHDEEKVTSFSPTFLASNGT